MYSYLQEKNIIKIVIATILSFILTLTIFSLNTVNAESMEATSIDLAIDFTSEEEVNGAFETFINNFDDFSDSEKLGYINDFLLFLDAEDTVNSQLEMFNILKFENEKLSSLVAFMKENNEIVSQSFSEEFEAINPQEANAEVSENEVSMYSNDVFTSSTIQNTVLRLSGDTRFHTAASISKNGWKTAQTVVIANSHNYADALAGVPLAVNMNAPILLSRTNKLEDATIREIQRLGAKQAVVLGGEAAVSKSVENKLSQLGLSVTRYAGKDRYDTAEAIAKEVSRRTKSSEAFLVSGDDFADAMSIAAIAGRRGAPIYLTKGNGLAGQPKKVASQYSAWYTIGGEAAISRHVTNTLQNSGAKNVTRLAGNTRYETNVKVLNHFGIQNSAYVATGRDFVDALTGSVLAGKNKSGIVLVNEVNSNLTNAMNFTKKAKIRSYTLFGGETVLPNNVVEMFKYERLEGRKPVIVIDPGHGGNFFGAVYGVAEKTLNLDTSKRLQAKLKATGKYDVVMTRETDKHFSTALAADLDYRSKLANNLNADIFISVHYNAGPRGAKGLETFVHHGTYPAQAKRSELNISNPRIRSSRDLADNVQNKMVQKTGLYNRGVKGLNLNVLRKTEMPAILVELGFMSDANELRTVRTSQYQDTVTTAIRDGINGYFGN